MTQITFQGNPLTLEGTLIQVGNTAPEFTVLDQELKPVSLSDFDGKVKVITTFPSLDTPVCDLQVKEFNKRSENLSSDLVVLAISKDLPFAQARFCGAHGIGNIAVLTDYKDNSFGAAYGLQIKELKLLARSVLIVDKDNTVKYVQVVEEVTNAPNYDATFDALQDVV